MYRGTSTVLQLEIEYRQYGTVPVLCTSTMYVVPLHVPALVLRYVMYIVVSTSTRNSTVLLRTSTE